MSLTIHMDGRNSGPNPQNYSSAQTHVSSHSLVSASFGNAG